MEKRDYALDLLKGIACVLMVFSHAAIETRNPVILSLGFLGSFAAVLFFSVTGITAWMQADRREPIEALPPYLILFLAGFSLNGIIQINFYQSFEIEMLQSIALGASLVYIAKRLFRFHTVHYLIAGGLFFFAKVIFSLLNLTMLKGWFIPPGTFTPIPWLFVFFLGVFAYQISVRKNLYLSSLAIFIILVILLVTQNPISLDLVNKWDMSIGYFLFSCFILFFSFYLVKKITIRRENSLVKFFLFLGKNSLLFLYVHIFVINILYQLGAAQWSFFYWLVTLAITSLLLYGILELYPKTSLSRLFQFKITWLVLTVLVMLTPLVVRDKWTIFIFEFLWGVLLSTNYAQLRGIFRKPAETPQAEKAVGF